MKKEIILDFHLFDGEGGGEGTGATASQSEPKQSATRVEYGKAPGGEGQTKGQVGSDNGAQGTDLSAEFAEMIGKGGRFHDIYGQHVSQAIQQRFKNQADLQGQVNQITEDLSPAFMRYGLAPGDYEGLKAAMASDESFFKAGAEEMGMDVDQYKQYMKYKADSERLTQINDAYREEQERQATYRQWEGEAEALKQAFPNFDLGLEIENNPEFANYLDMGASVEKAFMLSRFDEIMNGANASAQKTATQNVINSIQQRAARPAEGAMSHAPAVERRSDPSSLSDDDLDEINRRVANGEVFAF